MRRIFLGLAALLALAILLAMWPNTPHAQPSSPIAPGQPTIVPTDPIRGPADAPLTIIEYSDFTCPACAAVQPTLAELRARFGARLRIVWKDLPHLDRFTGSLQVHIAAACAGQQGKFWDFHDLAFRTLPRTDEELRAAAATLGISPQAFNACRLDPALAASMRRSLEDARVFDIRGTPAFFVNGVALSGDPTLDAFQALLPR